MTEPFELVHASAPEALGLERSCREHRADVSLPGKTNGCAEVTAMIRAPFGLWWQYVSHFSPSRRVVDRRGRNGRSFSVPSIFTERHSRLDVAGCITPRGGARRALILSVHFGIPSTLLEEFKGCPGRTSS